MGLSSYRREDVSISVFAEGENAVVLEGFIDGDFFTAERAAEEATLVRGSHGEIEIASMEIPDGSMTLSLMGGSPSNAVLQTFLESFQSDGSSLFTIIAIDTRSENSLAFCRDAILQMAPPLTFGNERSPREWTVLCPHLELAHSGGIRVS